VLGWVLKIVVAIDITLISLRIFTARWITARCGRFTDLQAFLVSGVASQQMYLSVAGEVTGCDTVLDVGAGGPGIRPFLAANQRVVVLDIELWKLKGTSDAVCSDARYLPFRERTFDAVVSVDTVEHVPKSVRPGMLQAMKRVSKELVVLYCPVDKEPVFAGRRYDIAFNDVFERMYGFPEPRTREHLECEEPSVSELVDALPEAVLEGSQSCRIWLLYMILQHAPLVRQFAWFVYHFVLYRWDKTPPYHACKFVYRVHKSS
jgi:hypothetical protein